MTDRARTLTLEILLGALVGAHCGVASAVFLLLLDWATAIREVHVQLVFALSLAGLAIGAAYARWGDRVRAGNDLVLATVHAGGPTIPSRMAPMVLGGTVATHLFGGSAGREGTAVQMGASLADAIAHRVRVSPETRRVLLLAGMSGGFGSVFGTPFAGAIFALEAALVGRFGIRAAIPVLVAGLLGDQVTRFLGVPHTEYIAPAPMALALPAVGKWAVFAIVVAAVAIVFIELTHFLKDRFAKLLPALPLRMAAGGLAVIGLWQLAGTDAYLGLGIPTIVQSFVDPALPANVFLWKLVFTAVTLGAGFIGGEVTPLFFIGAALGNVLGRVLGLPIDLAAGVGMAAMFGAAANAPIALSVMAVELLGLAVLPHVALVSGIAWLLTGHRSIYRTQRIARVKYGGPRAGETSS